MVNPRRAALDNVRRLQWRQVLQPQARSLGLTMPELPRLNALGELLKVHDPGFGVLVHHRIFDGDPVDRRVPEVREQRRALIKLAPHLFLGLARRRFGKPANARIAQSRAGRVGHHQQVPAIVQKVAGIPDDVPV